MIEIRNILDDELDVLVAFNKKHYRENHVFNNKRFIKWFFKHSEIEHGKHELSILGIFKDDKLVGILGYVPVYLDDNEDNNVNYHSILSAWIITLHISKEHLNVGYGFLLLREIMKRFPVGFGVAVNKEAVPLYKYMNMKLTAPMARYVGCYKKALMRKLLKHTQSQDQLELSRVHTEHKNAYNYKILNLLTDNELRCLQNLKNTDYTVRGLSVVKNEQFLKWRYEKHICFNYEYHCIKENSNTIAIAVVRYDTDDTYGYSIAFISDIIGNWKCAVEELFPNMINTFKIKGIDIIDLFVSNYLLEDQLKAFGFMCFTTAENFKNCPFPIYYHPIGYAPSPNIIYYDHKGCFNEKTLLLTGSLSPLDRPASIMQLAHK